MKRDLNMLMSKTTLLALGLFFSLVAAAGQVRLATAPLATSSSSTVQPNLILMLDDSGSMAWDYMPDAVKNFSGKYGFNSSQCNGTYYNPLITYTPPVNAAGVTQPDANFTAAWNDGFNTAAGATDLNTSFTGGSGSGSSGINLTPAAAFYYTYHGTQTTAAQQNFYNTSGTFYQECNSAIGSSPGSGVFTKVTVSATSGPGNTDERTNFANWYSYYSNRMLMMKTGVGRAFKTMNNKFRIGYMTMNNNGGSDFVNIDTFDTAQKVRWYNKLYGATPGQSTPLRAALSQVGWLYANKFSSTTTYQATVTVSGNSSTTVSSILVGTTELMAGTSNSSSRSSTVATNVAGQINAVNSPDYSAKASGSVITIYGPASAVGQTPVVTKSGSMTFTVTAFTAVTTSAQLNGVVPDDPMQYSCQKNFVILSTDGFWNGNAGYKLDGSAIGNQDSTSPRAMYDGSTLQAQQRTAQLQTRTSNLKISTANLQQSAWQLQSATADLRQSAWQLQSVTSNLQSKTSQLQSQTSSLQGTLSKVLMRCNNTAATCGSAPSNGIANSNWTIVTSGSCTTASNVQCQSVSGLSGISNVSARCNTAASISSAIASYKVVITVSGVSSNSRFSSIKIGGTEILTGNTSTANTNNAVAASIQAKVGNGYTATVSGNVVTVTKTGTLNSSSTITSYSVSGSATLSASTSAASTTYTLNNADSNGNIYSSCTYSAWSSPVGVATCTAVNQSGTPNNTTVVTAQQCSTALISDWADTASTCTVNTTPDTNGYTTSCRYNTPSATPVPVTSCTYQARSGSSPYSVITETLCSYNATPVVTTVTSCTTSAKTTSTASNTAYNANAVTCGYSAYSAATNTTSCTYQNQSTTSPYTGPAVACSYAATPTVSTVTSCTTSAKTTATTSGTAYNASALTCGYGAYSLPIYASSCTTVAESTTSPYTVATATNCAYSPWSAWGNASTCTALSQSTSSPYTVGTAVDCQTADSAWVNVPSCTPSGPTNGQTISCQNIYLSGGTADTLADTSMYYYQTDLRSSTLNNCTGALGAGIDVCQNNVPTTNLDNNDNQHLTTFTLGLGARGRMVFSSSYKDPTDRGDFYSIAQGLTANPPSVCSWQSTGACNWPTPSSNAIENIDDLWHAAVNGRGTYFSATNPDTLALGLSKTLRDINQVTGAAAAAATSTLNPVADNNFAYVASYTTVQWSGNLERRTIDIASGVVSHVADWCVESIADPTCSSPSTVVTDTSNSSTVHYCSTPASDTNGDLVINAADCASPSVFDSASSACWEQIANTCVGTLPAMVAATTDSRNIYTANSSGTALIPFSVANFGGNANFAAAHINGLSQWSALTATQQTAAEGSNLVNFLRGQTGFEENRTINVTTNWLYRYRDATFGDALESQPTFVAAPTFNYADPGYSAFKTAQASRAGTVFIGTNDGMLHAFNATNGVERWAYIPSVVIPELWRLADKNYASQHTNYVNGSPVVSDICTSGCGGTSAVWRTILVGGLNAGGRAYYALDITDPATPTLLWEFTPAQDANLGYSFGKPVVTKKQDGTWVVLLSSGYDNGTLKPDNTTTNSPTGDGQGHLYVLNAATGSLISDYSTGTGSTGSPSGFARFNAYNDVAGNNQAGYVYGGDLLGNVWRFDINSPAATGSNPFKLAVLKDASGNTQPVTVAPTLSLINNTRVIFVGTGKYLESSDLGDTQQQSLYAIKDNNMTTTLVNPRTVFVQQTITSGSSTRTVSNNPVDLRTDPGWYVNFPDSGERANIDFKLVQGTLLVPTIVPSSTVCSPGGYGWLNYFNYETGGPVDVSSSIASQKYDSPIVGTNIIYIGGNPIVEVVTSKNPTPEKPARNVDFFQAVGGFLNKRQVWRELIP